MKRTVLIALSILTFWGSQALAYEARFFRKFLREELKLEVMINEHKKKQVLIYVTEVDVVDNILTGLTNNGKVHIDINKIALVREQRRNVQGVYNHHE